MTTSNRTRETASACPTVATAAALVLAVFVCGLAASADAATRDRGQSPDVVQIDPVPRFDESEVRALIEKPAVTFSVDNARIASGGEAKLNWRVENADSVTISNVGNVGLSGARTVKPTQKTTYTLTARNRNGTVSKSVTVDITTLAAVIGTVHIITPVNVLENVHYSFVDQAKGATWGSSAPLSFGGSGGAKGWARVINSVRAEDDKDYEKVLQVAPEDKADGFIYGEYSVAIPPNGKFRATVGFTRGHGSPDGATVSLQVRGAARGNKRPPWKQILTRTITSDGKLDAVEADLSAWANQKVSIRLVVNARSKASDDMVLWIAPRIIK